MIRRRLWTQKWILACWSLGCLAACATELPEWRVTIDVQMVAVSYATALKLTPALRDSATFEKAFAELQQMIGREEADLVGWPLAIASGKSHFFEDHASPANGPVAVDGSSDSEPATSESVNETRFPTEFLPPQVPQTFGSHGPLAQHFIMHSGEAATPTAFEVRNLGAILAAEALVSKDGATIELSIRCERGALLGYQTTPVAKNPDCISGTFYEPQISIARNSARLTILNGKRMLWGTFVQSKPAEKVLLFLLKATAAQLSGKSPHL